MAGGADRPTAQAQARGRATSAATMGSRATNHLRAQGEGSVCGRCICTSSSRADRARQVGSERARAKAADRPEVRGARAKTRAIWPRATTNRACDHSCSIKKASTQLAAAAAAAERAAFVVGKHERVVHHVEVVLLVLRGVRLLCGFWGWGQREKDEKGARNTHARARTHARQHKPAAHAAAGTSPHHHHNHHHHARRARAHPQKSRRQTTTTTTKHTPSPRAAAAT